MCSVHCASLQNQINQMIMHTHTHGQCTKLFLLDSSRFWWILVYFTLRFRFDTLRFFFSFSLCFFQHEMLNGWLNHVVLGVDSSNAECPFLHRLSAVSSHTVWLCFKTLSNLTIGSLFHISWIRYCINIDRSVWNEHGNVWRKRLQARNWAKIGRSIRFPCHENMNVTNNWFWRFRSDKFLSDIS